MTTTKADRAQRDGSYLADAPYTQNGHTLTIAPTQVHADQAGGAALNLTSGFTMPATNGNVGYSLLITLGAGSDTAYTVTGTRDGQTVTETQTVTASSEAEFVGDGYGWDTITSITTPGDPGALSEFDTLDIHFPRPMRGVFVSVAGALSCRLAGDSADVVVTTANVGWHRIETSLIRCNKSGRTGITATAATGLTVAR